MLVGAVDIYTNHALVVIGATAFPEVEHDDSAATADDRHVVVRTRGPVSPTRVSIWSGTCRTSARWSSTGNST